MMLFACKDLFIWLPVGDLKCLEYWEQHKESRVDPVKTARFLEKTQCIIGLLPGLLGYKSPARPAIESPMLKNVNLVMDRCKRGMLPPTGHINLGIC
jgi:hypothetical protein